MKSMDLRTHSLQGFFSLLRHMSSHHRCQRLSHQEHAIVSTKNVGKPKTLQFSEVQVGADKSC
jgi:hypothetical protein